MTGLDPHAVSALLAERIDELARVLLPRGKAVSGCWRVGGLDGARGGSLSIALSGNHQGLWRDFATGERGDALDLVKGVRNCSLREAIEWSEVACPRRRPTARASAQGWRRRR